MAEGLKNVEFLRSTLPVLADALARNGGKFTLGQGTLQLELNAPASPTVARQKRKQIVVLIHGIRTEADWQAVVKPVLEESALVAKVVPIKYGFFSSIGLLIPFLRRFPIGTVRWKLHAAFDQHPDHDVSVVAHSFGTHIIKELLRERPGLRLKRLILCGSIIPCQFRWDRLSPQVETEIMNEVGFKDIWPVVACWATIGYGPSGTFGFGTPGITDRLHDLDHSDYLNATFARTYWLPLLADNEPAITGVVGIRKYWWSLAAKLRLVYIVCVLGLVWLLWRYF